MALLMIYTLLCGIWDLKTRHIHAGMSFLFGGTGLLLSIVMRRDPAEIGQALLPGKTEVSSELVLEITLI